MNNYIRDGRGSYFFARGGAGRGGARPKIYWAGRGREPPLPTIAILWQWYSYINNFQNYLLAAVAAAALCLIVYYCHENHLIHPHPGAPSKRDSCTTKTGQYRPGRHCR